MGFQLFLLKPFFMTSNERIVQIIYREHKELPLTQEERRELHLWLQKSAANQRSYDNLFDEEWMRQALKRYDAPGKEKGLQQLRERLIADRPIDKTEGRRLFLYLFLAALVITLLALALAFYQK